MLANSVDADQMPHDGASDLGLHCLPMTLLWVSWYHIKWYFQPHANKIDSVDLVHPCSLIRVFHCHIYIIRI